MIVCIQIQNTVKQLKRGGELERGDDDDDVYYYIRWRKMMREKVGFIENTAMRHRWGG